MIDPEGETLTYDYDAAHDLRTITDSLGNYIQYSYDLKGNRTEEQSYDATGSLKRTLSKTYDLRNHLASFTSAGNLTQLVHDAVGNLVQETDGNNHTTTHQMVRKLFGKREFLTMKIRSLWLGLTLSTVLSMSACGDYSIRLPNNYELIRVYAGTVLIGAPDGGVRIEANIDGYKVLNDLIVGHVTVAEHSPEKEMSKPGYFILNTKTHEVKQSLDKKTWLDALQAMGVSSEPSLGKPSRFDRNY